MLDGVTLIGVTVVVDHDRGEVGWVRGASAEILKPSSPSERPERAGKLEAVTTIDM